SQKRNATFERIRAAAGPSSQIAPMQTVILTDDEIRALVIALADGDTVATADRRRPLVKPLLLTRTEVGSRLYSIFRPTDEDLPIDDEVRTTIDFGISSQASFFGGHCNVYDECGLTQVNASQNPAASVVRAGLIVNTCINLLRLDGADAAVLTKVGLNPSSPASAANVRRLWDLFAPGRALTDAAAQAVVDAASTATDRRWTVVIQLFCRPSVLEAI
ncbi:MAG: hypothetical protein AAFN74_27180, partial [Myxococcota bacterium]